MSLITTRNLRRIVGVTSADIAASPGVDGAVLTSVQTLAAGQQAQVRKNVGASARLSQEWTNAGANLTMTDGVTVVYTLVSNGGAIGVARTVTLPASTSYAAGQRILFADSGGNIANGSGSITFALTGGDAWGNGAPILSFQGGWVEFVTDGAGNFWVTDGSADAIESVIGAIQFGLSPQAPNQGTDWSALAAMDLVTKGAVNSMPPYSIPLSPITNSASLADGSSRALWPHHVTHFNCTLIPAHFTRFRVTLYFGWTSNPGADLFPVYVTFFNLNQAGATITETLHGTRFGVTVYPDTSTGLPGTLTDLEATEPDSFKFVSDIITIPAGWQANAASNGFYGLYLAWIANNSGGALTDALADNHPITGKIDFFL